MIATIISTIIILPMVIRAIVVSIKKGLELEDACTEVFVQILAVGVLLTISLCFGYSKGDQERKSSIEEALSLGSNLAVHDAIEYNKDVRKGDNYFCRFTLRPDSDYIDITFKESK